jgi:hypothetical protein
MRVSLNKRIPAGMAGILYCGKKGLTGEAVLYMTITPCGAGALEERRSD